MPAVRGIASGGPGKAYSGNVTPFVTVACVVAAMGGLFCGYDIGISGGVTSMNPFLRKFFPKVLREKLSSDTSNQYCQYDSLTLAALISSLYLAALISTLCASYITRTFGRRLSMLFGGVLFFSGAIINGFAQKI